MKKNILLIAAILAFSGIVSAQNWNTAIAGFSSYDVGEYQKAKTAFETALKHSDEYKADENAKLNYYYGLSLLKLNSGNLSDKVAAYDAFEAAAKYDANGTAVYKGTLEVEMSELKADIKAHYDGMSHRADDKATAKLFMRVSEIVGYQGNYEDYKMKLESLGE